MRIKLILLSLLLFVGLGRVTSQENLNKYKYILVHQQYEFQKSQDSYQVNSLTKFLFNRAGFTAFFVGENLPQDLLENPCLALTAVLKNRPSFLTTRMSIDLEDCRKNVVFTTTEERSKEKDYKLAYHEAIRQTFKDLEALNYSYDATHEQQQPVKNEPAVQMTEVEEAKKTIPVKQVAVEAVEEKEQKAEVAVVKKEEPKKLIVQEKKAEPKKIKETIPAIPLTKAIVKEDEKIKKLKPTLSGSYDVANWGTCKIEKDNAVYLMKGGTEKEPQLVEMDAKGDLKVDSAQGIATYKRKDQ
jgi:hypothetical protein